MDLFEDIAMDGNGSGSEVQVEGSQEAVSSSPPEIPRPAKRRRVSSSASTGPENVEDDYDLPSYDDQLQGEAQQEPAKKDKYLMHDPEHEGPIDTVFVTQLTQNQHSSPSRIRGPRWRKKQPSPTPAALVVRPQPPPFHSFPAEQPQQLPVQSFEEDLNDPALQAAFDDSDIDELDAATAVSFQSNAVVLAPKKKIQKSTSFRQQTLFGTQALELVTTQTRVHNWPLVQRDELPTHHKLDREAMKTWVYPTNLGEPRDYQYNIVQRGLYHNTLVALPTGLGKTFIAATIMLNWFRWTHDAQIVFVAPTKPLVHQQVDACFNIVGIPRSQTVMLTGEVPPAVRAEEWGKKRVFFMTPQTLVNDYKHGYADPKRIVLLVVDEAHRATGGYDYVKVVQFLRRFNNSFRVLALTATPGASVEAVQKVIDGLSIARVEIRTEQSLDIREYVHTRNLDIELFDYSEDISRCLDLFARALKPVQDKLVALNAFWGRDPTMITVFGLNQARAQWMGSEAGRKAQQGVKGMVNSIFSVLMSLAHALALLKFHGIRPFYHKLKGFQDEPSKGKYATQIKGDEHFKKLMGTIKTWINLPGFIGHPKLAYLEAIVLKHFVDAGDGTGRAGGRPPSETRIMVFAHFRDSAEEIVRVLNRNREMVRAKVFVGQSSAKGSEGMQQKVQLAAIQDFKSGVHNVLVATSVGEEGLDIGEVDLIICYDASASPIRMLQRMGRTGRKRTGNIEVLLMRGKEENDFTKSRDSYEKMQVIIASGKDFNFHYDMSPRIVPREIEPVVDQRIVEIPFENTQAEPIQPTRKAKKPKPKKKFHVPDDAEEGFQTAAGKKIGKPKKKDTPAKARVSTPKFDAQPAALPSLDSVLLTLAEDQILEQTYAQVAGEENQYVQVPRLHAPETQRKERPVVDIQHSRVTRNLIDAFGSMRRPHRDWTAPSAFEVDSDVEAPITDYPDIYETRMPKSGKKRKRATERPSTMRSSGTVMDEDEYDLQDGFVDDGELEEFFDEEYLEGEVFPLPSLPTRKQVEVPQPYFVSQKSLTTDDDDEEELPDLSTLVGKPSRVSVSGPSGAEGKKKRTSRRVLDDSDE
jgi:ATP-dependent DNA helicase MPH1